jgi:hypothetical protein
VGSAEQQCERYMDNSGGFATVVPPVEQALSCHRFRAVSVSICIIFQQSLFNFSTFFMKVWEKAYRHQFKFFVFFAKGDGFTDEHFQMMRPLLSDN